MGNWEIRFFGTCAAVGVILGGAIIYLGNIPDKQLKQTKSLVQKVMEKAAGEDRVLSSSEKGGLLKKLGIGVIEENDSIELTPRAEYVDLYVYPASKAYSYIHLGRVEVETLKKYLEEKVEVEKNE